jgi:hypothetical protein
MKILFATPEVLNFLQVGGLAGYLPLDLPTSALSEA